MEFSCKQAEVMLHSVLLTKTHCIECISFLRKQLQSFFKYFIPCIVYIHVCLLAVFSITAFVGTFPCVRMFSLPTVDQWKSAKPNSRIWITYMHNIVSVRDTNKMGTHPYKHCTIADPCLKHIPLPQSYIKHLKDQFTRKQNHSFNRQQAKISNCLSALKLYTEFNKHCSMRKAFTVWSQQIGIVKKAIPSTEYYSNNLVVQFCQCNKTTECAHWV